MAGQAREIGAEIHRQIAVTCNNIAWSLIEKAELGAAEAVELVTLASAARYHWHAEGTARHRAHADLLLGWALARAGAGRPAVSAAGAALSHFEEDGGARWELAFAHAALAAAFQAAGDAEGFARHHEEAAALGQGLDGADATYFRAAFRRIEV